jgi:hypothetical protein
LLHRNNTIDLDELAKHTDHAPPLNRSSQCRGYDECFKTFQDVYETKECEMFSEHCPNCGSSDVATRTVNDRLRAADPRGQAFELTLRLPVCKCIACKFCWQGEQALATIETAYRQALLKGSPRHASA